MEKEYYEIHMNNGDVILYGESVSALVSLHDQYESALGTHHMLVICDADYKIQYIPACNISYISIL